MRSRSGFTIAELAFVLAVMGVIVTLTVPAGEQLLKRARADEARTMLQAIWHAEQQHFRDRGQFLACPAEGAVPRGPVVFPKADCWRALGLKVGSEVRYRYAVELSEGSFRAVAEGDLDSNGVSSRFVLDGRTQRLDVTEALE